MPEKLSSLIDISRQFLRSIRIDIDYGREDSLQGYICQGTSLNLLENMSRQVTETQQRAFTWTGPYGGGKSSLALLLCSLVSPEKRLRNKSTEILSISVDSPISKAFHVERNGWTVLPIVGSREGILNQLASSINKVTGKTFTAIPSGSEIIKELVICAESKKNEGVLVVIDELGKCLETAAQSGEDIFFYQELAEAASRCKGTLVIIGILHQAFEQYASRLGREARDEWAKVQGRFIDIPLISASDEIVELISRAIVLIREPSHEESRSIAEAIVKAIRHRRPGAPVNLCDGLYRCWPLHPITAALLGPVSKRKFSQNERSTFGFLSSGEPLGFREFLKGTDVSPLAMYGPAHYWDYLKANLEPSILASPDGHRWSLAAEAVERAEARGTKVHVDLTKTIALLDMFRNGSGLAAEDEVLDVSVLYAHPREIRNALEDLAHWSVIIYRKHLTAWGIYAGSDFDIDSAVIQARAETSEVDLKQLVDLTGLSPVLAKRHYQITGTMRWFTKSIVHQREAEKYITHCKAKDGSCGEFVLVIPDQGSPRQSDALFAKKLSQFKNHFPVIISVPENAEKIADLALELAALHKVRDTNSILDGDSVARREIEARISVFRNGLEEELQNAFTVSQWYYKGNPINLNAKSGLSPVASMIAEDIYPKTPHLVNELINRTRPSTNAVKARRDLLHRMLTHAREENLGYLGFPADASLYYALLKKTTLHSQKNAIWCFRSPSEEGSGRTIKPLWDATTDLIAQPDQMTSLSKIYRFWSAPPFGIREGVMPVLALAYFLANRQHLALYIEGAFIPELTESYLDEWLQDTSRISFRYVAIEADRKKMLEELSAILNSHLGKNVSPDPLDSARGLVALVMGLPGWTKRTTTLSLQSQQVRDLLLKASDPHKVLFVDLPTLLSSNAPHSLIKSIISAITELEKAYPEVLRSVESKVFQALDHDGDLESLRQRAKIVKGITGNFLLDSFSTRLATYAGLEKDIEGLISLAVNKPSRDWGDRDIDAAVMQLGQWSLDFRRMETLAPLQNRLSTRRAIAVAFGTSNNHSVSDIFDISNADTSIVDELAKQFLKTLREKNIKREVFLAALAEAGAQILETPTGKD